MIYHTFRLLGGYGLDYGISEIVKQLFKRSFFYGVPRKILIFTWIPSHFHRAHQPPAGRERELPHLIKNKHLYIFLNESYRSLFPLSICKSLTFYVNIMMQILKCILASQFLVAFKSHQLTNNRTPHRQSIWAPTGWHFGLLSVASIRRTPLLPLASTTSSLSLICSNATSVLNSSMYSMFWLLIIKASSLFIN